MLSTTEKSSFRLGDRVRETATGREGRILAITAAEQDFLLVKIGLMNAGQESYLGTKVVKIRRGQIAGLPLERLDVLPGGAGGNLNPTAPSAHDGPRSQKPIGVSQSTVALTQEEQQSLVKLRDKLIRKHKIRLNQYTPGRGLPEGMTGPVVVSTSPRPVIGYPVVDSFEAALSRLWERIRWDPDAKPLLDARGRWRVLNSHPLNEVSPTELNHILQNIRSSSSKIAKIQAQARKVIQPSGKIRQPSWLTDIREVSKGVIRSPKKEDPAALLEKVFGIRQRVGDALDKLIPQRNKIKNTLSYLTQSGPDSYYHDFLWNGKRTEHWYNLRSQLRAMPLSTDFKQRFGKQGETTAWDVLKRVQQDLHQQRVKGDNPYASWVSNRDLVLKAAFQSNPYRNLTGRIRNNKQRLEKLDELQGIFGEWIGNTKLENTVDTSDMSRTSRFNFQEDAELYGDPLREGLATPPGQLDVHEIAYEAGLRRKAHRVRSGGMARGLEQIGVRNVGKDPLFLNQYTPGRGLPEGVAGPVQHLWDHRELMGLPDEHGHPRVGRVVRYNGIPYRIHNIDSQLQQVRMSAVDRAPELLSPFSIHDPAQVTQLLDEARKHHIFAPSEAKDPVHSITFRVTPQGVRTKTPELATVPVAHLMEHFTGETQRFGAEGFGTFSRKNVLQRLHQGELSGIAHDFLAHEGQNGEEQRQLYSHAAFILQDELTNPASARTYQGQSLTSIESQLRQAVQKRIGQTQVESMRLLGGKGLDLLQERERLQSEHMLPSLEDGTQLQLPDLFGALDPHDVRDEGQDLSLSRVLGGPVLSRQELHTLPERRRRLRPFYKSDQSLLSDITGAELKDPVRAASVSNILDELEAMSGGRNRAARVGTRRTQLQRQLAQDLGAEVLPHDPELQSEFRALEKLRKRQETIAQLLEIQELEQHNRIQEAIAKRNELLLRSGLTPEQIFDPKRRRARLKDLEKLLPGTAQGIQQQNQEVALAEQRFDALKARRLVEQEQERHTQLLYRNQAEILGDEHDPRQLNLNRVTPQNSSQYRDSFEALLDLHEQGGLEHVPEEFRNSIVHHQGKTGIQVRGTDGSDWVYHKGGTLQNLRQRDRAVPWDAADHSTVASFAEFSQQVTPEQLRSTRLTRELQQATRSDQLRNSALHPGQELGVYIGEGGTPLGFHAQDPISWGNVLENTRELPKKKSFISLDIETSMQEGSRGNIYNIAAVRYSRGVDGTFSPKEHINLASPIENHEKSLRAVKAVSRQQGGQILGSEHEMLETTARFLQEHKGTVAGHNVSFDMLGMLQRSRDLGLAPEVVATFEHAAARRTADTLLLSQAALPKAQRYGLEWLAQTTMGKGPRFHETHRAWEDALLAGDLVNTLAKDPYLTTAQANLTNARQTKLKAGSYTSEHVTGTTLWDEKRGRLYEYVGAIDPEAAQTSLRESARALGQNSEDIDKIFGIALRPVNARGTASTRAEDLVFDLYNTPQTFAKQFGSRYNQVNLAQGQELLQEKTEDLARRRIRRMTGGTNAFEQMLLERERYKIVTGESTLADLSNRINHSESRTERSMLQRASNWTQTQTGDSRILEQLEHESSFWEEMTHHKKVVDMLEQHVYEAGRSPGEHLHTTALAQASSLWEDYLAQTNRVLGEPPKLQNFTVPLKDRKLSFYTPVLGENRVAIRIGSVERLEQDLQAVSLRVAKRLGPEESARLIGKATPEGVQGMRDLFEHDRMIWDTEPGQQLFEQIWGRHLQPSLAKGGFVQLDNQTGPRLSLEATTVADAVQELMVKGPVHAQALAENVTNPLQGRLQAGSTIPASLQQVQDHFLAEGVGSLLAHKAHGKAPEFGVHHGVADNWVGRRVDDVVEEALTRGPEDQALVRQMLQRSVRKMSAAEAHATHQVIARMAPDWEQEILRHVNPDIQRPPLSRESLMTTGEEVVQTAEKVFNSNSPISLAMRGVERLEGQGEYLKHTALGVGALLGATLLVAGMTRSHEPKQKQKETGFHSSEEEVEKRQDAVAKRSAQPHKVSVRIDAEDPNGVNHEELAHSIHDVLSSHFATPLPPGKVQVQNHQRPMNRGYLDQIASSLISSAPA